jgi:hypothetical protein
MSESGKKTLIEHLYHSVMSAHIDSDLCTVPDTPVVKVSNKASKTEIHKMPEHFETET